jgi:glycine cleavage system H protein
MKGEGKTVLPCNGLDKEAGALAREAAFELVKKGAELVCPVLFQRSPARYRKELDAGELLVIDGCKTGCASKLAKEHGLKLAGRLNVTEMLKEMGIKGGKKPVPDPDHLARLLAALEGMGEEVKESGEEAPAGKFVGEVEMNEFSEGKFIFKVPKAGYFFNENDCWARVEGTRARLGVSDYVQQSASDMVFFEPPAIGAELEQFDDAGSLESTKTALDIISPVGGKVVAVNEELVEAPELINEDPYVRGWAAEVELTDFESDRGLLMDCETYLDYLKEKVKKENEERYG